MAKYDKILVVQTAFIGDVILATSLLESLHASYPNAQIDFVLRKGNESLFNNHPFVKKIYIWNKEDEKTKNLWKILQDIRKEHYDYVLCIQRFFNAGLLSAFSGAKEIVGFKNNPFSIFFTKKVLHKIEDGVHEVDRNYDLMRASETVFERKLKLYPSEADYQKIESFTHEPYIIIAPASVWFTKQYPKEKWIEFLDQVEHIKTFIIGAPSDQPLAELLMRKTDNKNIESLCGKINLLQSAALMEKAKMCYVNDSAPQHLASAVNANVTSLFCSTVPAFGFGPLSDNAVVIESEVKLECRPCGLHGHRTCPEKHFFCGHKINTQSLLDRIN